MKQYFLYLLLFTLISLNLLHCQREESSQVARPNVLLILDDDMGYGDVGNAGNPYIRTPVLDQLAEDGIRFENFYVSSVCAPTRASLLTGRYHQRTGVRSVTNGFEIMNPGERTLAEILKEAGYRTGIYGKWHLGEYYPSLPNAQGFDEYIGFRTGHTPDYYDAVLEKNAEPYQTEGYITDMLTDKALDFMLRDKEAPFFCYLPYNAPHTPLQIDSHWVQPYLEQGLDGREARVYGMVENIDHNIGRMLRRLEENQLLENTIVIFMSDNGPISGWRIPQEEMRYNAGLRDQKFTVYEGGIRTQCYWMWKGWWPAGQQHDAVAAHIDVLPTLAEVSGIALPDSLDIDGRSLAPLLTGEATSLPERTFFQKYSLETLREPAPFPGGMARKGEWKMINGTELYNLTRDPGETENLAGEHPEILAELTREYEAWYREVMTDHELASSIIEVGYPEENPIFLQPHHGVAAGGLEFTGKRGLLGNRIGTHPSGVDGDWLSNWRRQEDRIDWTAQIVEAGTYRIGARMRGRVPDPAPLSVQAGSEKLDATIAPEQLGENWQQYSFGALTLPKGILPVSLSLRRNLGENGLEIRSISFERVD